MSELVHKAPAISSMDDLARMADMFAKSGLFKDSRDVAQAGVRILAGVEAGFGAFASMTGVHIIQGKPAIGANLMAQAIKRSGRYNYKVAEHSDDVCRIEFYERWDGKWEKSGESSFSIDDAKKANLLNNPTWKNYPRNMLFSRAISNGIKWFCPDVLGMTAYTPEELGENVNEDGEIIATVQPVVGSKPQQDADVSKTLEAKIETPQNANKTISKQAANRLLEKLTGMGFKTDEINGMAGKSLFELTPNEATEMFHEAEARVKETPWKYWSEDAALEYGKQFFKSGSELMTAWEEHKGDLKGWYDHLEAKQTN